MLITGDFNVAPTDQDVYEPEWLRTPRTRARPSARACARSSKRASSWTSTGGCTPSERGYTCWDQRDGHYARDYGLRIDLALASEHLTPYVTRCDVNHTYRQGRKPSNHAPLEIELEPVA